MHAFAKRFHAFTRDSLYLYGRRLENKIKKEITEKEEREREWVLAKTDRASGNTVTENDIATQVIHKLLQIENE